MVPVSESISGYIFQFNVLLGCPIDIQNKADSLKREKGYANWQRYGDKKRIEHTQLIQVSGNCFLNQPVVFEKKQNDQIDRDTGYRPIQLLPGIPIKDNVTEKGIDGTGKEQQQGQNR